MEQGTSRGGNMLLTLTTALCVLSCLPVISYGFDLPFLTEARRRTSQNAEETDTRQHGLLSELLPSSRMNAAPKGELTDIMRASPPKHIVKLLQKMSLDQDLLQRGNTVRSVVPTRRNICGKDSFVFPLRTMGVTEQLHTIELHYFVRKLKRWSNENLRLNVHFHLINNETLVCDELGSLQLPPDVRGWQTLNMTSYIDRLMNETSPKILVGVTFSVTIDQPLRGGAVISEGALVRKILSKHVKPFMLVYTEDQSASDDASAHLGWQRIAKDMQGRSNERPSRRRQTRSVSNVVTNNTYSLITNEFPDDIDLTRIAGEATFPFFTEQNSRRRKARKKEKEKEKKRRQKNKKGKHSKHLPLLDQSGESEEKEEDRSDNTIKASKSGLCSRQPMRVDFNKIGWDGYVIAPEGFDAYYCAGQCPFPLTRDVELSNHAAIQSVVNALGAVPNVPAPCCVPDKMSSISILFFDEDKNVALKSYQNMQVDSCGCR